MVYAKIISVLWPAWKQVVLLLEVDAGSSEGGEGMLEILLAIGFVYLCYAIALHEANKKN